MGRNDGNTVRFEGVIAVRDTGPGGALLCKIDDAEHWVPHSLVHDDSEVFDAEDNDRGVLVVPEWWAVKAGLV